MENIGNVAFKKVKNIDLYLYQIFQKINFLFQNEKDFFYSFPFIMMIAFVFSFVWLGPLQISIDGELSAMGHTPNIFLSQGRWAGYLYSKYLVPQPAIPYFPGLLYIVCISISYMLITRMHNMKVDAKYYLLFPIYCAFPSVCFLLEFSTTISATGPLILLTSVSAFLFKITFMDQIINDRKIILKPRVLFFILLQALMISFGLAITQSTLTLYISFCFGALLVNFVSNFQFSLSKFVKIISFILLMAVTSLVLYFCITSIVFNICNIKIQYVSNFFNPESLLNNPLKVLLTILNTMWQVYSGSITLYQTSLHAIGILMGLGIICLLIDVIYFKNMSSKLCTIFLLFSCLLIPFLLNFLNSGNMPFRALIAIPYTIWLFSYFALLNRSYILKLLSFLCVIISSYEIVYATSLYSATREITWTQDKMTANSLYLRIVSVHEDFDKDKNYPIDYFGSTSTHNIYPSVISTCFNSSFFSHDQGNPHRMLNFMSILGYNNFHLLPSSERLKLLPHYEKMPVWPANGSVRVVDGITLVKLGKNSGVY